MTPAQVRALAYGAQLAEVNDQLATRAGMARTATNRGAPLAAWLLGSARLVVARRQLRAALFDALLEMPAPRHASPYWQPPAAAEDSAGIYRGRHAAR